ncbi:MFS transporter permease [Actinomyces radicidentis]|uniref:MFS transporter permease n=1 Tax=Actinomyces radicidentis TaxID=111015 RepID=A0A0X8JG41_ACTRD|nr:MFS transporter [Actinomyces radicidentis]AMD88210.1 MFS transporter permease [Actinomyces radicidentis]
MRLISFATLFVIGTDTFLTAPLLPLLQREFGVSVSQSGWLVSAYALGYALFALIAGPISDRLDRRKVLLAGLIGFTVFTAACGGTWDFWSLFATRLFAGIAAAFVTPQIWASIPVTVAPPSIVKTMGYATAGLAIAQVVGIPIGSFLSSLGWRIPFFAIAAASVLLWILLYARFPNVRPANAAGGRLFAPYAHVGRSRPLMLSLVAYLLFQTGNFAALSFIGSWFSQDFGATQTMIGAAMIVIGLGNAIGSLTGSRLVARLGQQRSLLLGILALGAIYLVTAFVHTMWIAVVVLALGMLVGGFLFPVLMSELQSHTDLARGTVSSLSNAAMYAGTTIGGAVGGYLLTQFTGYSGVAVFTVAAYIVSLGVYAFGGAFKKSTETIS